MNLREKLNEYYFNLETAQLFRSLGRTTEQVANEMNSLNFSTSLLEFQTSSKHLYDSVMLRLRLYSENNFSEDQVRKSFVVLNNSYINSLLNYLYSSNSSVVEPVVQPLVEQPIVEQPLVEQQPVTQVQPVVKSENLQEVEDSDVESDEENPFDSFFENCVEKTEEATDIVKLSDFYQAFSEWWKNQYNDSVPDKKELKNYLNEKLEKSKKSTWTNVVLSN